MEDVDLPIALVLPELGPGERGRFDFVSALACINCDTEVYGRALAREGDPQELAWVMSTFWHERFHFLQAITCGYLYDFANSTGGCVVRHLNRLPEAGSEEASAVMAERLAQGDVGAGFWFRLLPDLRSELEQLAATLRHRESGGVSPLDLIEGSAFFYERLMSEPESFWQEPFEAALESPSLPAEYVRAYRFAQEIVGEDAINVFQFSVLTAFRLSTPALAFEDVLLLIQGVRNGQVHDVQRELDRIVRRHDAEFLGTAQDRHEELREEDGTFYAEPLRILAESGVDEYDLAVFGKATPHLEFQLVPTVATSRDQLFQPATWDDDHVGTGLRALLGTVCMDTIAVTRAGARETPI